jgi:1-acyl-sn-glycerol-3-phosphate acyltransferase
MGSVKVVGKADVFRIPFFGWALRLAGKALPVHFDPTKNGGWGTVKGSTGMLMKASEDALISGQSIGVAPEGARMGYDPPMAAEAAMDQTGLMPFKLPFFELARRLGVPVVVVVTHGADDILPVGSFWLRPGTATIHIRAPIYGADYASDQAFADAARSSMGRSYRRLCSGNEKKTPTANVIKRCAKSK